MSILQILVEVPHEIMSGLQSGYYTRDAAGIIRWARGTEKAGEIVVHLREISSEWQAAQPTAPNLLLPMGALMAVQLAGFAYLGFQLKQIGNAIASLHQDVHHIMTGVQAIREQQYIDRLNQVAHGVEHLMDAQFQPALLDEARKSFGKARGEIRLFLDHQTPVALVEHLPQTERLLQGLVVSFAGEYMCLHKRRAELAEIGHVCHRYSDIMSEAGTKLREAPPIHRPPLQSSRYLANFTRIRPLREGAELIAKRMADERQFVETLAKVDSSTLLDLSKAALPSTDKAVMVLYP